MANNIIQSIPNDITTSEVMDWIHLFTGGSKQICLINNTFEVKQASFLLCRNENCKLTLKSDSRKYSLANLASYWYRRGGFSYDSMLFEEKHKGDVRSAFNINASKEIKYFASLINSIIASESKYYINKPNDNDTNKIYNLYIAQKCDLLVPNTIFSNDLNEIIDFVNNYDCVVVKDIEFNDLLVSYNEYENIRISFELTLINKANYYKLFNKDQSIKSLFFCQEYIDKKYELRIFFLNEELYAMAIFSQANEKTKTDYRHYDYINPNRCVPYRLPEEVSIKILNLIRLLNLTSGSIDMIYSSNGEYVFLEVNPIGQFHWLSKNCNYYLEKKIANEICRA